MEPTTKPPQPAPLPNPITEKHLVLGGNTGLLGAPVSTIKSTAGGRGRYQIFERGEIYWSPETGAREVHGAISNKYGLLGGGESFLGLPRTDEVEAADGVGAFQVFERGRIFWHPEFGAHEVHGGIGERYWQLEAERGPLGYPVTDELPAPGGPEARYSFFQRGVIYYTETGGVQVFPYTFLPD